MRKIQSIEIDREQGFTLVEMLVAVLIIGILASIAIPALLNQKKASIDSEVKSDVKGAVMAVERWLVSHPNGVPTQDIVDKVKKSDTKTVIVVTGLGDGEYLIKGTNPKGATTATTGYTYNSKTDTL